jgi:hypothetical protein
MNDFLLTIERIALALIIIIFAVHYTFIQISNHFKSKRKENNNGENH